MRNFIQGCVVTYDFDDTDLIFFAVKYFRELFRLVTRNKSKAENQKYNYCLLKWNEDGLKNSY